MERFAGWHRIGNDIVGATSVDDALHQAGLDFEVLKQKIYLNKGGMRVIDGYFANVRADTGETLGVVTEKYNIVQNAAAFDFINNLVAEGMEFEKGGVFHGGKSVWVEAKMPGDYKILGDDVESHICLVNSHNGKGSVKVAAIPFRLFCSNQLNFAFKQAERIWSVIHSSKLDEKIAAARSTFDLTDKYMAGLNDFANKMAVTKFDKDKVVKLLDEAYPVEDNMSARKLNNINTIKNGIIDCLDAEDLANFKGTKWQALGAVTDFFDHREAARNTAGFEDARWESIISGNRDIDMLTERILAA